MKIMGGRPAKAIALSITLVLASMSAPAEYYTGPMIDAHGHLGASFDREMMVSIMDGNKVTRQIVMARYYPGKPDDLAGSDAMALQMADTYPGQFFPLVGMQRPKLIGAHKWRHPNADVEAILSETEEKLASGRFHGIGEVIVKHFAYSSWKYAEMNYPVYCAFMQRLSRIAARFDVPLVIHMEGAPNHVRGLSRLLRENPGTRYVWAHNCGRSKATVIRSMLVDHPNLYCDLAAMTNVGNRGYGIGWPRMEEYNALIEEDGVLFPQMRELFEDFPDRFMIGMDVAHAPGVNPVNYGRRSQRFRRLLGQLRPETAAAIAEGNAVRLFQLDRPVVRRKLGSW